MNTLTAIVCNYNHGSVIGRALEALLTQSRPPDQLVVVDDASLDDSVAIIERWAAKHPTIQFLRNERNLGLHESLKKALGVAVGTYVYVGSADDHVLPGFFESVCGLMDQFPCAGVGCANIVCARPDGLELNHVGFRRISAAKYISSEEFLRVCLKSEPPQHSLSGATIFRNDWLSKFGGPRKELGAWYDTFAIRAIALRTGICYVPQPGMVWSIMPDGLSQSTLRDPQKSMKVLRSAASLMRSPEFADVFPAEYVDRWEAEYIDSLVLQPLQPAIQGYQAVQKICHETAAESKWPTRWLLGLLRRCMTFFYLATHHLQCRVIRHNLLRDERHSS